VPAAFLVDLLIALCVLLSGPVAALLMVPFVRGAVEYLKQDRLDYNALTLDALSYSDRHRHLVPLFRGMTAELGVVYVEVQPKGPERRYLDVTIGVTWWCRWWPGEQRRLSEKAKVLLREGGVRVD
jgi:hypothetical protein